MGLGVGLKQNDPECILYHTGETFLKFPSVWREDALPLSSLDFGLEVHTLPKDK